MCQFVPLASCPTSEHQWKEPVSVFFAPTLQVFLHMGEAPSLSQAIPSSLGLSSQERCFNLFVIIVALHWSLSSTPMSLLTWVGQKQTQDSRCSLTGAEQRGRTTFLSMQPTLTLAAQHTVTLLCCRPCSEFP